MTASGNNKISMPFSPGEAAKGVAAHFEGRLYGLHRIDFVNSKYYQEPDGNGTTAYDHLLVTLSYKNARLMVIALDTGTSLKLICSYEAFSKELNYNESVHVRSNFLGTYPQSWFRQFFTDHADQVLQEAGKVWDTHFEQEIKS